MILNKLLSVTLIGAFLICTNQLSAQSYQGLDALKLMNAVDGDSVVLDHKSSGPLVVLIFTSNYCPYSRKYEERIKQLYQDFSKRDVQFFLVNPNEGPDDSLEEMKAKALSEDYQFPYLKDHQQVLTDVMGASRTPEAFVLKPVENGFELVYRGAIDDNPQTSIDVENAYLRTALQDALSSRPVENAEVRVTGCIIKN